MSIEVVVAEETSASHWRNFLGASECDHHAWSWEWREVLAAAFGHKPYYLVATASTGDIKGVLPLFEVKSKLFGHALISLPYLNAGGLAAEEIARAPLIQQASELARSLDVRYVELRHRDEIQVSPALIGRQHKIAVELPLRRDADELFSSFPAKLRSQIRKPMKSGVELKVSGKDLSDDESLRVFYRVFSEHMRDLGTPVYPYALFAQSKAAYKDRLRIFTAWHGATPIAAGITLGLNHRVEIPWASSLRKYNHLSSNMLLYWEALRVACADGYHYFDFGRSTEGTTQHRFKEQWGGRVRTLHWQYLLQHGNIPEIDPHGRRFRLLVQCWRRLPLPIANSLGPYITRGLP